MKSWCWMSLLLRNSEYAVNCSEIVCSWKSRCLVFEIHIDCQIWSLWEVCYVSRNQIDDDGYLPERIHAWNLDSLWYLFLCILCSNSWHDMTCPDATLIPTVNIFRKLYEWTSGLRKSEFDCSREKEALFGLSERVGVSLSSAAIYFLTCATPGKYHLRRQAIRKPWSIQSESRTPLPMFIRRVDQKRWFEEWYVFMDSFFVQNIWYEKQRFICTSALYSQ